MEPRGTEPAFRGRFLSVDVEDWPGLPPYEVVHHLGAAAVLPITPAGQVVLVRQFRPAIRQTITEIPAGLLDVEGEDALTCATRELFEETGYRHTEIAFMGGVYVSPGFTDEYMHLFWAWTEASPSGQPEPGVEVIRMPLYRAVAQARAGKVRNATTALGLLLAASVPTLRDAASPPA